MAQASALAIEMTCALRHGFPSVVEPPLRPHYRHCTSYSPSSFADATTFSLFTVLEQRGGGVLDLDVATAPRELIATLLAVADGTAFPCFFLSGLNPIVGKITTLIQFVWERLRSKAHKDVAAFSLSLKLDRYWETMRRGGYLEARPY